MNFPAALTSTLRKVGLVGASVLALLAGAGVTAGIQAARSYRSAPEKLDGDEPPRDGIEEVAVLIGASWCSASKMPGFDKRIPEVFTTLHNEARSRGHPFSTIGVSLDLGPVEGIRWLSSLGRFDQVISGRSWTNTGYVQYVLSDSNARKGVPQLVVLQRHVTRQAWGIEVGRDSVLERLVGPSAIMGRARVAQ